ncbi:MAG TPA: multicopper oxidase [Dongiaceae bacterium]|nr:multicopper oxidase [Dongiaceae bacterium]
MRKRRSFFNKTAVGRRGFLKVGAAAGVGSLLLAPFGWVKRARGAPLAGGSLDPTTIAKYSRPVFVPPAMPMTATLKKHGKPIGYYEIAVRQFRQQILPEPSPMTTVWGYGSVNHSGTFNYPAYSIEAEVGRPVRVKWINELVDENGHFLPYLLPVDQTLHWAYPPGGTEGRDMRPTFTETPGPYTGPVPIVTHLHGGRNAEESDGFSEAWYLPAADDIPSGFATEGSHYETFRNEFLAKEDVAWEPGTATFQYQNKQSATTLWYHDHCLGVTRVNVYAGLAGFYLLRGGPDDLPAGALPGPAPEVGADPFGRFYEIPLVIQDRSFNADGSLFYPDSREFFDGFAGPYIPETDVPPIWNPEFFGNTMVVNGRTWPFLEVEPRRYRFRVLNASNARFVILKIVTDPLATRPASTALPMWQIGADRGFLRQPTMLEQLLIAPAERADVIVDFSGLTVGTELFVINEGPDEPFGGGAPETDFAAADPGTTGQVMKLVIVPLASQDESHDPASTKFRLPTVEQLGPPTVTRQVSLNEEVSTVFDGPIAALLGTLDQSGAAIPLDWAAPITENPRFNAVEMWELHNFTEDAHPIHIHEIGFEVVNRQPFDGAPRPPEPWETGRKDTVVAFPEEITRVKARFNIAALSVWHCHILEHEDNQMMRPYRIERQPSVVAEE